MPTSKIWIDLFHSIQQLFKRFSFFSSLSADVKVTFFFCKSWKCLEQHNPPYHPFSFRPQLNSIYFIISLQLQTRTMCWRRNTESTARSWDKMKNLFDAALTPRSALLNELLMLCYLLMQYFVVFLSESCWHHPGDAEPDQISSPPSSTPPWSCETCFPPRDSWRCCCWAHQNWKRIV